MFELLTVCIAIVALGVSVIAVVRSGKAIEAAREANKIATSQTQETKDANCPQLVFACDTAQPEFERFIITVTIFNSGNLVTEIVKGQIALSSYKYPEAEKPYELAGKKIAGRDKHTFEIKAKRAVIYSTGPEIAPTEIICHAVYTRPEREDGEETATYKYDSQKRKFV